MHKEVTLHISPCPITLWYLLSSFPSPLLILLYFSAFGMACRNLFSRHLIGRLPPFHLWVSGLVFLGGLFSISQEPWWWWMMGAGTVVFSISPSGSHLSRISHKRSRGWCAKSTAYIWLYSTELLYLKKKRKKSHHTWCILLMTRRHRHFFFSTS